MGTNIFVKFNAFWHFPAKLIPGATRPSALCCTPLELESHALASSKFHRAGRLWSWGRGCFAREAGNSWPTLIAGSRVHVREETSRRVDMDRRCDGDGRMDAYQPLIIARAWRGHGISVVASATANDGVHIQGETKGRASS